MYPPLTRESPLTLQIFQQRYRGRSTQTLTIPCTHGLHRPRVMLIHCFNWDYNSPHVCIDFLEMLNFNVYTTEFASRVFIECLSKSIKNVNVSLARYVVASIIYEHKYPGRISNLSVETWRPEFLTKCSKSRRARRLLISTFMTIHIQ